MSKSDAVITIVRGTHDADNPFFVASRDTAQDESLSYEARGILFYLLSKPGDWKVMVEDLIRPGCGRDKVYRVLNELKAGRYLTRTKYRDEKGRWQWTPYRLYERPLPEKPSLVLPYTVLPDTAQPYTEKPEINTQSTEGQNTEGQNTDQQTREEKAAAPAATDLPERLNIFAYYDGLLPGSLRGGLLIDELKDAANRWPDDWLRDAFLEAAKHNGRSWAYVEKILLRWQREGKNAPSPKTSSAKSNGAVPARNEILDKLTDEIVSGLPDTPPSDYLSEDDDESRAFAWKSTGRRAVAREQAQARLAKEGQ